MFTVCPKCALTLVVTGADLRVAQGYVRCGRCSSVFNALARLSEERLVGAEDEPAAEAPAPPPAAEASAPEAPAPASEPPQSEESIAAEALEFDASRTDLNQVFVQVPPDPEWTAATGSFREMIAANEASGAAEPSDSQVDVEIDAAFLASMLRAESLEEEPVPPPPPTAAPVKARAEPPPPPAAPESPKPAPPRATPRHPGPHPRPSSGARASHAAPLAEEAPRPAPPPPAPERTRAAATAPAATRAAQPPAAPPPRAPARAELEEREPEEERDAPAATHAPASRLTPHLWTAGVVLAALGLTLQIINHNRDELAASARFNRPLTSFYARLGIKLFPHWDLRAYDVRQLGASAEGAASGVITVRASIKNSAAQPQPLPLLRVTLQDRFGNRIAARDVAPHSYLPHVVPAASFLSAGQRIDAEMGFADPGADAVGFEIDACLPARGGGVACANDAVLR